MSNMSYCRFENTLLALQDCYGALEDGDIDDMSPEEERAMKQLIKLCGDLHEEFIVNLKDNVVTDHDRSYGPRR